MEFQIGKLTEEHQNTIETDTHTHTHTHTHTYIHTPNAHTTHKAEKDSQLHKLFKKAHMSHKYLLALKDVLMFCGVTNTLHNVIF